MKDLNEISEKIVGLVERSGASVVRIGRRRGPVSGVAWAPDVVVTASHVLHRDEDIEIGLPDGGTATGTLAGRDPGTDVAVLRITGAKLAPLAWAGAEPRVGSLALALSRPGREVRSALGVVAALGEAWRLPGKRPGERVIETDIDPRPGSTGGPVVDATGAAIGLHNAGLLRGRSLAVPAATVRRVVETLLQQGRIERGYLGIGSLPVRLPAALEASLGQPGALLVLSVQPDSPADKAGLALGDVIAAFDGHPLRTPEDLIERLDEARVGASASLRVVRGGEPRDVQLTVGARAA